jgi:hypothetical protein
MVKNSKKFTISINHHIYSIFHAENNLSNFAHFIGPIFILRGPASLLGRGDFSGSVGKGETNNILI